MGIGRSEVREVFGKGDAGTGGREAKKATNAEAQPDPMGGQREIGEGAGVRAKQASAQGATFWAVVDGVGGTSGEEQFLLRLLIQGDFQVGKKNL